MKNEKLLEFARYFLPIRYWFHCHTSLHHDKQPMDYGKWKRLIMGIDCPSSRGGYTAWRALTGYRWYRVHRWAIFSRWFWGTVPIVWQYRAKIKRCIETYWKHEHELNSWVCLR